MRASSAFTILELMLGLFLASVFSSVLLTTYLVFKACYQRVMMVATLQDDGRFAVEILRRHIHAAEAIPDVIPQSQVSLNLKQALNSKSDILILKEQGHEVAFYVAATSWMQHGKTVRALFEKPLGGKRQELVDYVETLHVQKKWGGVSYTFILRSEEPVLRFAKTFTDSYLYRTWYGFAVAAPAEPMRMQDF